LFCFVLFCFVLFCFVLFCTTSQSYAQRNDDTYTLTPLTTTKVLRSVKKHAQSCSIGYGNNNSVRRRITFSDFDLTPQPLATLQPTPSKVAANSFYNREDDSEADAYATPKKPVPKFRQELRL
jgi:hypothetical protein